MKYLIFGLGNIGAEYEKTRHNVGFDILDEFSLKENLTFSSGRYANFVKTSVKGRQVMLIKPTTYMNLSGKCVRYWMQQENVPVENILVICDDISLPVGKIRIRKNGSDGGHNGLSSIIEMLGSNVFSRMRVGIGNDFPKGYQVEYVLGKMNEEERKIFEDVKKKGVDAIKSFVFIGIDRTMNIYN